MALYDVFISYAEADHIEVNALVDRLRRDIPGIRIFQDSERNELSEFERTRIIKAIDDSTMVIFAFSENSLVSESCEKEVMYAKNTGKRVIPYLLPGMTLKGWLLYELGRVNCINSTNESDVARLVENVKQRIDSQESTTTDQPNQPNNLTQEQSNTTILTPPISITPTTSSSRRGTIESQLVFDHRTGEFVSSTAQDRLSNQSSSEVIDVLSMFPSITSDQSTNQTSGKLYLNGHQYVDLGLPSGLKWAACNLGSYKPEESGTFFAWGEVKSKNIYPSDKSEVYMKDLQWLKSNDFIDEVGHLSLSHDAARKNWGSTWRMPSKEEFEELQQYTTMSWHRVNGVDGCMLESTVNRNSIFLPAFGRKEGYTHKDNGILGMYWSSTVNMDNDREACRLAVGVNLFSLRASARFYGLNIRPVSE